MKISKPVQLELFDTKPFVVYIPHFYTSDIRKLDVNNLADRDTLVKIIKACNKRFD